MEKDIIVNILAILVVLGIVFFSQQPQFSNIGGDLYIQSARKGGEFWIKSSDWFKASIYPNISGEVAKRGEVIKEEITKQKDGAVKNIWENIKSYFAEKFSKTFGTKVE